MVEISVDYLLFDLDGTLVNSTAAVEKNWHDTVNVHNSEYPDLVIDPVTFLQVSHGSRTVDTFKRHFPYRSSDEVAVGKFEFDIVQKYGHLAQEIEGTSTLISSIEEQFPTRWAIVTSGTQDLAHGWFKKLFGNLSFPRVFITANDVTEGKPNPEGYLAAFHQLCQIGNTSPQSSTAVVFEDAPTGIRAGINGGFKVIGIASTFDKDVLLAAGATYVIKDMHSVTLKKNSQGIKLCLDVL
ncbi:CIC11C00000000900 [Sungouiella intermedia]|uniref:CIC11C00000000900 n=1 Tax=Sungouiella intermedia TaxID=45354 RepID=A0A1L0BIG1_9ASCO|nr:CIC11C00000000900 [[Candida] intermedia]